MTELFINGTSVDMYEDIPVSLNYSIADIRNPDKRNTSYSKTIKLPGSKTNNKLFSFIFELSKESISNDVANFSPDFNASIKADCKLYADTLLQIQGYCQLLRVIRNDGYLEYEICIFGSLGDFFTNLEGLLLTDLNFEEYNHLLNQKSISNSWDTFVYKNELLYSNFECTYSKNYPAIVLYSDEIKILTSLSPSLPISTVVNIDNYLYTVNATGTSGIYTTFQLSDDIVNRTVGESLTVRADRLTATPSGEGYVYPCINYGETASMYYYDALKFYPAIYVKEYLNKIVEYSGFTWSGNFKDSSILKHLIIPASSSPDRVLQSISNNNKAIQSYTSNTVVSTAPTPNGGNVSVLLFPNTIQDVSNVFNTSNGEFYANKSGAYDITIQYDISASGGIYNDSRVGPYYRDATVYLQVELKRNNSSYYSFFANSTHTVTNGVDGLFNNTFKIPSVQLSQYDKLRVKIVCFGNVTVRSGTQLNITPLSIPLALEDVTSLSAYIPKNVLAKDFFLSIVKMFKLYIRQDTNNQNNLIVEFGSEFYNDSDTKDWTKKLDRSKEISIVPVGEIEAKSYEFLYTEDSDYYNKFYKEQYKEVYGNRSVDTGNDFAKGKKDISLIFSPTVSVDSSINKMVVPHIAERNTDGTFSPTDSNIRILYYGMLKPCVGTFKVKYDVEVTYTSYPYCGHVDNPLSPNLDLLFEIPKALYWGTSVYTTANLYNVYYKKDLEEITDKDSKLIRASVRLTNADVFSLDFKNIIQVDNINYRLNKIVDYNPLIKDVCIAELSKVKNGISFTPFQIDYVKTPSAYIIQGGRNEVRSITATSPYQVVQGGIDEVQNLFSGSEIQIITGGLD